MDEQNVDIYYKPSKSDEHAFCMICSVDLFIGHGSQNYILQHMAAIKYITMAKCYFYFLPKLQSSKISLISEPHVPFFTVFRLASLKTFKT